MNGIIDGTQRHQAEHIYAARASGAPARDARPAPWAMWASSVGIVGLAIAPDATVAVLLVVGLISVWRAFR